MTDYQEPRPPTGITVGGQDKHYGGSASGKHTSSPSLGFASVITMSMGIAPLLVYGLSALSPQIVEDLELSHTQFGGLATVAFIVSAASSMLAGSLVDRVRERLVMVALYGGSALALLVAASAWSYPAVLSAVVVAGAVQALSDPISNRLINQAAFSGSRGTMMGVKQAGVQMTQAFAGLALPILAVVLTWRGSLGVASILAGLGLFFSSRYLPAASGCLAPLPRIRSPLPGVVWWLAALAFLGGAAMQGMNVYLPLYGHEFLGLPQARAGLIVALIGLVGLASRIVWGRLSDRLSDDVRTPLLLLFAVAILGIATIHLASALGSGLLWLGAGLFAAGGAAVNVVLMVTVIKAVPAAMIGRATGIVGIGLYLGFALGPITVGAVVDATGHYGVGWLALSCSYLVAGLLVLLLPRWQKPLFRRS